jgi:hypothetical protein
MMRVIPLYWPLTWPRDRDDAPGRFEDWLLWRWAHRKTLAALFATDNSLPPGEERGLLANAD